ncbi:MAG: AsmA-like C-terminal domain-containing protein [Alphaproteobacteria bacterium]
MIARTTRVLFEVLIASIIGVSLLAGYGAWRLSEGPVSVGFLTGDIEQALNSRTGAIRLKLGDTMLAWAGWERALDLRVVDVRITGEDGVVVARIPEMSISFSALALLRGVVAPTSLDIIRPRVTIVREPSGDFAFALEQADASHGDVSTAVAAFMAGQEPDQGGLSTLRRISVLDAQITLDDRFTGVVWRAPNSNIILLRENGEVRASINARLDEAAGGASVTGGASWKRDDPRVMLEVDVANVDVDRIAGRIPGAEILRGLGFSVAGRITAQLDLRGTVRSADFSLTSDGGELRHPKLWPRGAKIGRLAIAGSYLADPDFLEVESLDIDIGDARLSGQFTAIGTGGDFAIEGNATVQNMPISALRDYWPRGVAPTGRTWVLANMSGGQVDDGRMGFSLHVPAGNADGASLDSLSGQFRVSETRVRYMAGMPPVQNVSAAAVVTPNRLIVTVREGTVAGLKVESGTVRLTGLSGDQERAEVDLRIVGPVPAALALIDRPRLGFATRVGIDPAGTKGRASVRLSLRFPLIRGLTLEQLEVTARAQIFDAAVPKVARGRALSGGAFNLVVDKKKLVLDGTGLLGGVPAKMRWSETFGARGEASRQYTVTAVLDDEDRKQFGLEVASYVEGPVALDLAVSETAKGIRRIDVKLELKDAVLSVPGLGWRKKSGAIGVAWFSLDAEPGKPVAIREFNLRTTDLEARGTVGFDAKGRLARAGLTNFRYGKTRLAATLHRRADDGFNVSVEGPGLDIRPFLEDAQIGDVPADLPPLSISGKVDRLWFGESPPLREIKGKAAWDGDTLTSATLVAQVGKASNARLALISEKDRRRLVLSSDVAGDMLSGFGLVDEVRGGKLRLGANQRLSPEAAPWTGMLAINDFAIVNAPVLARMLTLASLTGISDVLAGRGVHITRLQIPFSYDEGNLKVNDARAVGSELGLTAKGTVDMVGDVVKIDGTIVPAYTINSVLGKIPILGRLFTSDKGSGMFAATYRVDGRLKKPTVTVNPLAVLAPGFLRGLVGNFDTGKINPDLNDELFDSD